MFSQHISDGRQCYSARKFSACNSIKRRPNLAKIRKTQSAYNLPLTCLVICRVMTENR